MEQEPGGNLPNALAKIEQLFKIKGNRQLIVCLDYDGTMSPIVSDPDAAVLPEENRKIINQLSKITSVVAISGRDLQDLKSKIEIDSIIYAGSHGFDITGPDNLKMVHECEKDITPALDDAEKKLNEVLNNIKGVKIERKKFAIAVHYRNVEEDELVGSVIHKVQKIADSQKILKTGGGKKIMELKPDIEWNKGYALTWLQNKMNWNLEKYFIIFIGDDLTDEDGFKSVKDDGIGILVGSHGEESAATFALKDTKEVTAFLEQLNHRIT